MSGTSVGVDNSHIEEVALLVPSNLTMRIDNFTVKLDRAGVTNYVSVLDVSDLSHAVVECKIATGQTGCSELYEYGDGLLHGGHEYVMSVFSTATANFSYTLSRVTG